MQTRYSITTDPARRNVTQHAFPAPSRSRRGSTLLIVLVLMGMLALLGVLFYTFAAQEQAVASSFSNDSRVLTAPALEPDLLLDFALEQLLLGPDDLKVNSALWGGRHSIIPNMLGRDGVPFSGEGVRIIDDPMNAGNPVVDLNYDGSADNSWLLGVNDSPGANGGFPFSAGPSSSGVAITDIPAPDADYTYPGFDHLFLAHRAWVPEDYTDPSSPLVEVILPSFHRPGLLPRTLREIETSTLTAPTVFFDQPGSDGEYWFGATGATSTTNRVFRPHRGHRYVTTQPSGGQLTTLGARFVRPSDPPLATDLNTLRTLGLTSFFPPPPQLVAGQPFGEQGAYETHDDGMGFTRATRYGYDVDLDGDGIRESVLIDLDFPPQRRGDGKLVIPMFAFHILDANGLLNLNVVGNLAGNLDLSGLSSRELGNAPPNSPATLTRSNLGFSVSEINPAYAFSADPSHASLSGSALEAHRTFLTMFGHNDVPRSRRELANLEWLFLNIGRPNWNQSLLAGTTDPDEIVERITALVSGRYGEVTRLQSSLALASANPATLFTGFPFAGTSAIDDNLNDTPRYPLYGTPYDPVGWGDPFQSGGRLLRRHQLTNHPIAYQQFDGYNVGPSGGGIDARWYQVLGQALVPNFESVGRLDEAAEIVVDPNYLSDDDQIFTVDDTAGLHLGASDFSRMAKSSRLRSLAPANFDRFNNGSSNNPDNARLIRERFTTLSTDRREFAIGRTTRDEAPFRRWESEFDDGTDIQFQFPPVFSGGDPFRAVTRNLLQLDDGERIGRFKLDLNRILRDNAGNLEFRRFTDYAENDLAARQERQAMARDIYVLLYTFCGGADTDGNFTTNLTNSGSPFSSEHMRRMAQFAVNIVDAVDRDNVTTEFWYDVNLSDGWNEPDHRVFGVERQLVAISEALAVRTPDPTGFMSDHMATMFQENVKTYDYLFLELMNLSPENLTLYDGTRDEWRIRRDDDDAVSGIEPAEYPEIGSPAELTDRTPRGTLNGQDCIITIRDNTNTLNPGQRYVIASQDGTIEGMGNALWSSEIRIDTGSGFERVLPNVADTGMPPTSSTDNPASFPPIVDLDLCHDLHSGRFAAEVAMPAMPDPGCLVRQGGTPVTQYRLRLEHRAKGYRDAGASPGQTNGWAIVDKTNINVQTTWSYDSTSSGSAIRTSLYDNVQEQYRAQPLRRLVGGAPQERPVSQNTFKTSATPHDMGETSNINNLDVQLHFDRDLMSVAELLYIPTFAPRDLTDGKYDPNLDTSLLNTESFAWTYFLNTSRPCGGSDPNTGNRWYRLLNFVEVTPPLHREAAILNDADVAQNSGNDDLALPTGYGRPTLPGQLNPNTIRHPEVLAGLLDDQRVFNGFDNRLTSTDSSDIPGVVSGTRDWWEEFLVSRDRFDEVTGLTLPGTPVSNPFRGLGHLAGSGSTQLMANSVLEQTLLRSLPADSENTYSGDADRFEKSRRLFQIENQSDHTTNAVHPYARHRLLQKALTNSTTRSNTFLVWVGVQFHEAAIDINGAVRVGGRLEDTPLHRGFFVIDRAEAVEQVKRLRLLGRTMDHDNTTGILKPQNLPVSVEYFSYRALSSPGANDGIDWRALIKYRQLLN